MKKLLFSHLLIAAILCGFPKPGFGIPIEDLNIDVGAQYRVMYNNSGIGSGKNYDFFRQRMRINLDIKPSENSGGFVQLEYQGGFGGSSPGASDPRGRTPPLGDVPFNRLQARGIRYGYIYAMPLEGQKVMGGILPLSDRLGDTLFSADWDFNVGGVLANGDVGPVNYRAGYVRLIEGLGDLNTDRNGNFYVADIGFGNSFKIGAHLYHLYTSTGTPLRLKQTWYGVSVSLPEIGPVKVNGFAMGNSGKYGATNTSGFAGKLEGTASFGKLKFGLLGIASSGNRTKSVTGLGNEAQGGFLTPQGILGTGGYWGYTYVFTPHGPSDVNDFGLEIGNRGYGLNTVQVKVDYDLMENLSVQAVAGWFESSKKIGTWGRKLGNELGLQLAYSVVEYQKIEFGAAFANLGDAGLDLYQGAGNKKKINELFARWQLEF